MFLSFLTDWGFVATNYVIFNSVYNVLIFHKSYQNKLKYTQMYCLLVDNILIAYFNSAEYIRVFFDVEAANIDVKRYKSLLMRNRIVFYN